MDNFDMDKFERELIKHKRRLAKKMTTYIQFLEDNGIEMTLEDEKEKIEHILLCRDVCARKWAK